MVLCELHFEFNSRIIMYLACSWVFCTVTALQIKLTTSCADTERINKPKKLKLSRQDFE